MNVAIIPDESPNPARGRALPDRTRPPFAAGLTTRTNDTGFTADGEKGEGMTEAKAPDYVGAETIVHEPDPERLMPPPRVGAY